MSGRGSKEDGEGLVAAQYGDVQHFHVAVRYFQRVLQRCDTPAQLSHRRSLFATDKNEPHSQVTTSLRQLMNRVSSLEGENHRRSQMPNKNEAMWTRHFFFFWRALSNAFFPTVVSFVALRQRGVQEKEERRALQLRRWTEGARREPDTRVFLLWKDTSFWDTQLCTSHSALSHRLALGCICLHLLNVLHVLHLLHLWHRLTVQTSHFKDYTFHYDNSFLFKGDTAHFCTLIVTFPVQKLHTSHCTLYFHFTLGERVVSTG